MPTLSIQCMSLRRQVSVILQTQARSFELKFINVQHQIGANDCGLFAIANATSLYLGSDPHLLKYDQSQTRNHLCKCFENNLMTAFPEKGMPPRVNLQRVSATLTIPVYCSYRRAYMSGDSEMIQCSSCSEWLHKSCFPDIVPSKYWTTRKNWICSNC